MNAEESEFRERQIRSLCHDIEVARREGYDQGVRDGAKREREAIVTRLRLYHYGHLAKNAVRGDLDALVMAITVEHHANEIESGAHLHTGEGSPTDHSEEMREMVPIESLRRAVNAHCTCGGGGPNDPDVCEACRVWHDLNREEYR